MTEYLGSRISLISKRDVRYVGTLIEINSEQSTVALENVSSYGTEGRCPGEEIAPMDEVYGYIVFRGSDVKDLRIEGHLAPKDNTNSSVPNNDPAIIGSKRRPQSSTGKQATSSPAPDVQNQVPPPASGTQQAQPEGKPYQSGQNEVQNLQGRPQDRHQQFSQQQFQYGMPPLGRFPPGPYGPQGQPNHGFPGSPYGPPPGSWYPPYGMPPHMQGPIPQHQMPIGPPDQFGPTPGFPQRPPQSKENVLEPKTTGEKVVEEKKAATPVATETQAPPPPPVETKPSTAKVIQATGDAKGGLTAGKHSRLIPAVPLTPTIPKSSVPANGIAKPTDTDVNNNAASTLKSVEDANRDARAAVAAAMAKISGTAEKKPVENDTNGVDNITKGVSVLRTNDTRGRGRGNRGNHRGDRGSRVEVPKADFDFESSNAKFNKQDLVKEAIATGSPLGETAGEEVGSARVSDSGMSNLHGAGYNKSTSFFDDISSEIKDRAEGKEGTRGGREFRSEERAKNLETFGQGSVDNYRHYNRGRGRGRGRGFRGRGRVRPDQARGGIATAS